MMKEIDQKFMKDFGAACKLARRSMRISQTVAADKIPMDFRHYQNIEGGKVNIRVTTLLSIARFYGISINVSGPYWERATGLAVEARPGAVIS